jgi:hypothetical protein
MERLILKEFIISKDIKTENTSSIMWETALIITEKSRFQRCIFLSMKKEKRLIQAYACMPIRNPKMKLARLNPARKSKKMPERIPDTATDTRWVISLSFRMAFI